MANIVFFEKPGCGTNARQKWMLEAAGHTVIARNLLTEPWTARRLRGFFGDAPVASWFNAAAPRVKSGEIDPEQMDAETALALMLSEPLLIRRPLMDVDGRRSAGFEGELIASLLGEGETSVDVQGCGRAGALGPCPAPADAPRRAHS